MNRPATTLTLLAAFASFAHPALAADASVERLNSRIQELESRLEAIEQALRGSPGSHSYDDGATREATNGGGEAAPKQEGTYVIRDGDTLGSIARKHGVKRSELLKANRLSEGQPIYIGETLAIPGKSGAAAPGSQPKKSSGKQSKAKKDSPSKPESGNTARSEKPAPAQQEEVVVGETRPEEETEVHTVVKGDTLTSLSRQYGTSVADLKRANGLSGDGIDLGQELTIPTGGGQKTAKNESGSNEGNQEVNYEYDNPRLNNDETYGYYTVQKGDNLYALARDFFTTMAELQRLNELGNSTLIYPGDDLIVPTSEYNAYHNSDGQGGGGVAQR